jgi:ubiquinone/menaquinone biosynthesis C-methylase UbiE
VAGVLFVYGTGWWYVPFAVVAGHVAAIAALAAVGSRISSRKGSQGLLIDGPRLYDVSVRVLTLGRERRFREQSLQLAELRPGDVVLDVGCGTGTLLLAAAERIGSEGELHGIDASAQMIARARAKGRAAGRDLALQVRSADELPFPDASFDVLFCTMVLHHLPVPTQLRAISEMRRVLEPGGRIVIVEMQRARTLAAAVSLVSLVHGGSSEERVVDIESELRRVGFGDLSRSAFGAGAMVGIAGRVSAA